jgi:hypothetical protein
MREVASIVYEPGSLPIIGFDTAEIAEKNVDEQDGSTNTLMNGSDARSRGGKVSHGWNDIRARPAGTPSFSTNRCQAEYTK